MIRDVKLTDAKSICDIYNYYVLNTCVTFEESAVSTEEMAERIREVNQKYPWLIYEENNIVIGFAYANAWKVRLAYRYSVEATVYLKKEHSGKGIGTKLYTELVDRLKNKSVHAVMGGIALPNFACVSLHKKFGFVQVAHFKEVGFKFHNWIDVTYWELVLN